MIGELLCNSSQRWAPPMNVLVGDFCIVTWSNPDRDGQRREEGLLQVIPCQQNNKLSGAKLKKDMQSSLCLYLAPVSTRESSSPRGFHTSGFHREAGRLWHPPLRSPAPAFHQSPRQRPGNNGGEASSRRCPATRLLHTGTRVRAGERGLHQWLIHVWHVHFYETLHYKRSHQPPLAGDRKVTWRG